MTNLFNGCIDVSHAQGKINWPRVFAANYHLAFIKATQGTRFVDPAFTTNRDAASAAGLLTIPYHFINLEPANLQAEHFFTTARLGRGSCVMLDWEAVPGSERAPVRLVEELIDNLRLSIQRLPVVYHGMFDLSSKKINACPWHIPKWGTEPKTKFLFWQNTPSGVVSGISTPVDHDFFNGTLEELGIFYHSATLPKGAR